MRPLTQADAAAFENAFAEMGWHKPAAQFDRYLREQEAGQRTVLVAAFGIWDCTAALCAARLSARWRGSRRAGRGRGRGCGHHAR